MSSLCTSAIAALDDSLALLYESSGKLKAAKSVDIAEVIEQLKMAAESARTVRELVWSELPEASWQTREELDALIEKIQRILEARTLEQLRSRLLALATELERGTIVHRRAHRVNELKQLRDQAINELRSQAGLEGAPQTLPGPEAGQWIEWACSLQEPEDAESLQALRNGFAHLDDLVANLEPSMWVAADSPALETPPEPERSADRTQPKQSRLETNRFEEPVVSSGPNLAMKVGFDPKDKEVVARMATENTSLSQPQEVAASSEVPAVQSEVPVLADALAALDDSLGLLYESLEELKAAKSVDIAAVIEQLKMAAKSARTVRELVWSELPEASWQTREELDALIEKIQRILEARTLEQLRSRLLALATELERGTIVHRRAHRVDELKQLRDQAINELRSQGGLEGAPQTLPGPEAGQWIEWACGLQEPEDAESLQVLRNGFAHLDDFVANLEPSMWVAADSPKQSRLETNRFEEPVVLSGPKQIELDAAKSPGGRDEPRLPNPRDELSVPALASNTLTPNDVTPPRTEEEIQRIQEQERALLASMMGLASDPVGHFSRPVEPPFTAEVFREPRAAPAIATRPVEPPFTTEAFREPSSAPASTKRPGEPHSTAETKAFRETSAAVAIAKCPVEPTFTAETETFRETNAATFRETNAAVATAKCPVEPTFTAEIFRETIVAPPGLVSDPISHFNRPVESPFAAEVFRETSDAPAIRSDVRTRVEEPWGGKWRMLLAAAAVLVLAALVTIQWRSHRNHASNGPIKAVEKQVPDLSRSNPENKGYDQSGMATDSDKQASNAKTQPEKPSKPQDQSVAPKPPSKAPPAKPTSESHDAGLRSPITVPKNVAMVNKEEAPPNGATGVPGSVPGGLPNAVPNSVINIVKDIRVAEPKVAAQKVRVSSGVAQGLLVRQVTPRYPAQARQAHIQGTVVLQAVIGKDGTVQDLHAVSGHPLLIPAAMDAVKNWRYKPYQLNGEPVEADTQINVNFTLSGE